METAAGSDMGQATSIIAAMRQPARSQSFGQPLREQAGHRGRRRDPLMRPVMTRPLLDRGSDVAQPGGPYGPGIAS